MGPESLQIPATAVWELAERQHGVAAREQLLALGLSVDVIRNRVSRGRLHPIWSNVYAVGRPQLTRRGRWMAAVLTCGERAALSHKSAAELWGIAPWALGQIHVSVPPAVYRRRRGIRLHRRATLESWELTDRDAIPVTTAMRTLIDLATYSSAEELEGAVNEADKLGLVDPETLRAEVEERRVDGAPRLRQLLDRRTFSLTNSELERRFLRLVRRANLPSPLTQQWINGFRVDFFWPELGLIVETDGLRYHRTATQQSRDRSRDQAHAAAGLIVLRFTHAQVSFEDDRVIAVLRRVAERQRMALLTGDGLINR
jgi:very-short-patch-repair endonuclease